MNEIIVNNYELPKLEIKDYDTILANVKTDVEKYKNYIVTKDTLDDDTKKKTELKKLAKAIDDRRKEIKKAIETPIKEFEIKCNALRDLYESSAQLIDNQIKVFENQTKQEKKTIIEKFYQENNLELNDILDFNKIFDDRWLNKTYKIEDIQKEIINKVSKISNDLKAIEELNSEYEVELKNEYLNCLDLGLVLIKNNELNKKKELLKKASIEREKIIEEIKQDEINEMLTNEVKEEEIDPVKEYTLKLTAPLSKMSALRKFMELNNIKFERID